MMSVALYCRTIKLLLASITKINCGLFTLEVAKQRNSRLTLKVNNKKETLESLSGREWLNLELGKTPKILAV